MRFQVGAEGWSWQDSAGKTDKNARVRIPEGIRHAVPVGDEVAVCPHAETVHLFKDLDWEDQDGVRSGDLCKRCIAAMEKQQA